jgi:signal transduction histidine kinase
VIEYIEARYLAGRRAVVELPIETPSGDALWIHLEVDPYRDASGDITDFVCIATDITDRRLAELALERHDRRPAGRLDEEAPVDLQPLAHVARDAACVDTFVVDAIDAVGVLGRVLERIEALEAQPLAEPSMARLEALRLEHARARRVVSRLDRSMRGAVSTSSATDLSALLRSSARSLLGEIPSRVTIDTAFEEAPRLAIVDAGRVSELVLDLMRSAFDAIGDEWGVVSLTTGTTRPGEPLHSPTYYRAFGGTLRDSEPRAFVEIHDTAATLAPAEMARLAEPLLPVSGSRRVQALLRARTLLAAMGAELHVGSVPGCGTRVLILLPSTGLGQA